ncbi:MAG: hypothetical protein JJU29_12335 [Verrucomicrobia bacterium]|nr:hypothetical protein [Verrucomicrobiota bacterium]MCH8510161.1 hypothetical protein [Kiritimatiellia bacterium]
MVTLSRQSNRPKRGSALLVTLLVISLMLIMVVAFATFVRMSLREITNHQQLLTARANARLGAEMAVASLQELLGPDQRVTARGEIFEGNNVSGVQVGSDLRRIVGVWNSTGYNELDPTAHANAFLGWLISSGEPGQLPGLNDTPPGAGTPQSLRLVGPGSVAAPDDHIYARKVTWQQGINPANAYAWMVDDNGLKAQLASHLRNDEDPDRPPGGGVLPGAYPLGRLEGMNALDGVEVDQYQRLISMRELPLLPGSSNPENLANLAPTRFFDFTTSSKGVLANVRDGGLKKDLTIAFENDTVFNRVFPTTDQNRYLLIPPDKLSQATDLRQNGYIHWNIFKDYYNLKRLIQRHEYTYGGNPGYTMDKYVIDTSFFGKENIATGTNPIALGTIPPHGMGPSNSAMPSRHRQQPYGNLVVTFGMEWENAPNRHNHIGPILSSLQNNAWLEYTPPANPGEQARLTTRIQFWTGHYNPYNIGLSIRTLAHGREVGPRVHNYPQIYFHVPGVVGGNFNAQPGQRGLTGDRESNARDPAILSPGQSQYYGIEHTTTSGALHNVGPFGPFIRDNISATLYDHHDVTALDEDREYDLTVTFRFDRENTHSFMHGADMHPTRRPNNANENHDMEVTQVFYAPFAWNSSNGFPAKSMSRRMTPAEMNENNVFSAGMHLRTTRESPRNRAIRPLIDANIRAPWVNPRWDSPLNLNAPAAYAESHQGEYSGNDIIPQMEPGPLGMGYGYLGADRAPPRGHPNVILFEIPREDLVSLGQLQHAAAGRFSYEPSYIVANSYANPRIPFNQWRASITDTYSVRHGLNPRITGNFNLYDASYLVNQRIWDEFTFTTLPHVRDNATPGEPPIDFDAIREGQIPLANPRFLPYTPYGSAFTRPVLQNNGNTSGTNGSFFHNAGHVMVDGAFNVNSTSVAAWEAFLTGTLELPVQAVNEDGEITGFRPVSPDRVRFPRVKSVFGEGMASGVRDDNYWTGFRELTQEEVRAIAAAMVEQVKRRGPFLNMGQFINRMLRTDELAHSGPLQAALDATVNQGTHGGLSQDARGVYGNYTQGTGFPGQLLQGDLLQALGPLMQVRSDTFTIRAYGETHSSPNGGPAARAWCEVKVQRLPDAVIPNPNALTAPQIRQELNMPTSPFGRQFRIVSFRWLNEDEI